MSGGRVGVWAVNAISLARLALGVAFPLAPPEWRLGMIVVGGLSDAVDGVLSRLLHAQSTAGQILDPVADKVFIAAVLITLLAEGRIAWWAFLLVAARDLCVFVGSLAAVARRGWGAARRMPPSWVGKATTLGQFLYLIAVMAGVRAEWQWALFAVTAVASIWAGVDYLGRARTEWAT